MWYFITEHSLQISIIIIVVFIISIFLFFKLLNDNLRRIEKKADMILYFCKNKYHTFSELRDEFPKISSLKYSDLFETKFKLSDIKDTTKITITLYYSEEETREKIIDTLLNNSITNCIIGCANTEAQ